jgi:hypothetical protein
MTNLIKGNVINTLEVFGTEKLGQVIEAANALDLGVTIEQVFIPQSNLVKKPSSFGLPPVLAKIGNANYPEFKVQIWEKGIITPPDMSDAQFDNGGFTGGMSGGGVEFGMGHPPMGTKQERKRPYSLIGITPKSAGKPWLEEEMEAVQDAGSISRVSRSNKIDLDAVDEDQCEERAEDE